MNYEKEVIRATIVSFVFQEAQPDRGDFFGWIDDRADELAQRILDALNRTSK